MDGFQVTAHGYTKQFKNIKDRSDLLHEMDTLSDALAAAGYSSFIHFGTLLGFVRSGDFIPHDDDVDFGVVLRGHTPDEIMAAWAELYDFLDGVGLIDSEQQRHEQLPLVLKIKTNENVGFDIFPCWFHEGKFYSWPCTFGGLSENDILPLKPFPSQSFMTPQFPERVLECIYGPGWKVPDPNFRHNWTKLHQQFAEYTQRDTAKRYENDLSNSISEIGKRVT